jgi:hypothetical protein
MVGAVAVHALYCPGPAVVALASLDARPLLLVVAVGAGTLAVRRFAT